MQVVQLLVTSKKGRSNMGINRNRVFNVNDINRLSIKIQNLMDTADKLVKNIYDELGNISSTISSLPSEVKDHGLQSEVDSLRSRIRTQEFLVFKKEVNSKLKQISERVPREDLRLKVKIDNVIATLNTMKSRIDSLKDLIPAGKDSGAYEDFKKKFEKCTKDWDAVNDKINSILDVIKNSLKGGKNIQVCYGGDPVNLSTGNFIYNKSDLTILGSPEMTFTRSYNELDKRNGVFGRGWVHPYEVNLIVSSEAVIVILPDGREEFFEKKGESFFGEYSLNKLEKVDGGFCYTEKYGDTYTFNEDGLCIEWNCKGEGKLAFSYHDKKLEYVKRDNDNAYFELLYNELGQLSELRDNGGRKVFYEYDINGKLTKVHNSMGEEYHYIYDENGRLASLSDGNGREKVYNIYDEQGRTKEQRLADGSTILFDYDDEKGSVTVTEKNQSKVVHYHNDKFQNIKNVYEDGEESFLYNKKGQLILRKDCNGNTTRYSYDSRGNLTQIIDGMGVKSNATYDKDNHLLKLSVNGKMQFKNEYDRCGNLLKMEDALGRTTQFEYWKDGKPSMITHPDGGKVKYDYDERDNVIAITKPSGSKTTYEYDSLNRVSAIVDPKGERTSYVYDDLNRLKKVINPLGQAEEYEYNLCGKQTVLKRFDGSVINAEYNERNRLSKYIDAEGNCIELSYDNMSNISEILYPNGAKECYQYDGRRRLKSYINALGGKREYQYDANGNCILDCLPDGEKIHYTYTARNEIETITDNEGNCILYEYDERGHITKRTDAAGNEEKFVYDNIGQLSEEIDVLGRKKKYTYTPLGDIETITDFDGNVTHFNYEFGGMLKEVIYQDGLKESYSYDENNNISTYSLNNGLQYTYEYDSLNRVTKISANNGEVKQYEYDLMGNVILLKNALGECTHYEYSPNGRLKSVIDAMGNETCYDYNEVGQLVKMMQQGEGEQRVTYYERNLCGDLEVVTDALGLKEFYKYNANRRLIEKKDKDGYVTKYGYTSLGNLNWIKYDDQKEVLLKYNQLQQLTEINDWLGTTKIENDPLGRILGVEYPDGKKLTYTYDNRNNRDSLTYPDGKTIRYEYDECSRLVALHDGDNVINYAYDEIGRIKDKRFPNGTNVRYSYDNAGRISECIYHDANGILDRYLYSYDVEGRRNKIEKHRRDMEKESGVWEYSYDPLGRISEVYKSGQQLREYQYDAFGNRKAKIQGKNRTSYTYNALNQLISEKEELESGTHIKKFKYDNRGNMLTISEDDVITHEYEYGSLNRLQKVVNFNGEYAQYDYNGLGHRVAESRGICKEKIPNPERQINYILDLTRSYNNILQRDENGKQQSFLWDDEILSMTEDEKELFYLNDDLGSPIRYLNDSGEVIESYAYTEFGEEYCNTSYSQPFGYTGYLYNDISGTMFAQAREYLSSEGRFASEDKVKGVTLCPFTMNPYVYCWNDPFSFVDSTGLSPRVSSRNSKKQNLFSELAEDLVDKMDALQEGNEAHRLLQAKFMGDYRGRGGQVEYYIKSGIERNKSGTGRADIVYFNASTRTVEVYEIKPGSYCPGSPFYDKGIDQLDGYIKALRKNGQIINNWGVKRGYSLNGYFNEIVIPSQMDEKREIVYHVYENGLINYYYRYKQEKPEPVVEPAMAKDEKEKLKTAGKVVAVAGGGYVLYRVIRFLPSLLPPLWPTIPANVACP